jgi:hypothetical protein
VNNRKDRSERSCTTNFKLICFVLLLPPLSSLPSAFFDQRIITEQSHSPRTTHTQIQVRGPGAHRRAEGTGAHCFWCYVPPLCISAAAGRLAHLMTNTLHSCPCTSSAAQSHTIIVSLQSTTLLCVPALVPPLGVSLSHITHHSPLITRHSSLVTHHSSLITHHSSLLTPHSSPITYHLSPTQPMPRECGWGAGRFGTQTQTTRRPKASRTYVTTITKHAVTKLAVHFSTSFSSSSYPLLPYPHLSFFLPSSYLLLTPFFLPFLTLSYLLLLTFFFFLLTFFFLPSSYPLLTFFLSSSYPLLFFFLPSSYLFLTLFLPLTQHNITQHNNNTTHNTTQHTTQHNTTQHNTTQHNTQHTSHNTQQTTHQ